VTTAHFRRFLDDELLAEDPDARKSIDVDAWLGEPGLRADAPDPRSPLLDQVDAQVARWRATRKSADVRTEGWSTQSWLHFLEAIAGDVDAATMADLDGRFDLTNSGNAEILCVWLRLSIQHGYAAADAALVRFLTDVGRRKFLEPL
jgi:hypothetical protein